MTTTEDAAVLLAEVVGSLDNLPSEVHHILQEIGHKEGKTNDIKNRAIARDQSIQRHARPVAQGGQGLLVPNSKEPSLITKIRWVSSGGRRSRLVVCSHSALLQVGSGSCRGLGKGEGSFE